MEKLRLLRKQKKLTQKELGAFLGLSAEHICRIEKGKCKPGQKTLYKMAAFFGCTVEYLLSEGDGDVSKIPTTTLSEEIIETLERCVGGRGSRGCWGFALERDWECDQHLRELSIYLINRQKKELGTLKEERENMQDVIFALEEEKLQLQGYVDEFTKIARVVDTKGLIERAVKETAKEICLKIIKGQPQPIQESWADWFKKEYGVEVE